MIMLKKHDLYKNEVLKMQEKKKVVIAVTALIAAVAVFAGIYFAFGRPQTTAGSKTITVEVIAPDYSKTHEIKTDAEFLGEALKESGLIEGQEGQYGLFITAVDSIKADDSKQQWWCITKGGADVMTGIDATPIADSDTFELTLKEGY